jgi:hypothetical protein
VVGLDCTIMLIASFHNELELLRILLSGVKELKEFGAVVT